LPSPTDDPATSETPSYHDRLPRHQRRLATRLESFGDIVFGFAVSQCALELPTRHGHVDVSHPLGLLLYFGTFALLASLWLIYHRMMAGAYKPAGLDLFLAFAFLAFVSLMPFALFAMSHESTTLATARVAVADYTALYALLTAIGAVVNLRNLRREDRDRTEERDRTWMAFLRLTALFSIMLLTFCLDLAFGPLGSTPLTMAIPIAIRVLRRRFPHAPRVARRVPGRGPSGGLPPPISKE
jgi:uncharacterized membrane protein